MAECVFRYSLKTLDRIYINSNYQLLYITGIL